MAVDVLALHIEGMVEDGEPAPEPNTLDAIMSDPDTVDGIVTVIGAGQETVGGLKHV